MPVSGRAGTPPENMALDGSAVAVAAIAVGRVRVGYVKRRHRSGPQLIDEVLVLRGLGCREIRLSQLVLEGADLSILVLKTVGDDLIVQSSVIRVLVLRDVTDAVCDGLPRLTGLGGHVVRDLRLPLSVLAAAVGKLRGEAVSVLHGGHVRGVDRLLHVIACLVDGGLLSVEPVKETRVHSIEAVAKSIVDAVELVDDALGIKSILEVGSGRATSSVIVAVAVTSPTEDSEQDDENPPSARSAPTVITFVAGDGGDVGQTRCTSVKHGSSLEQSTE